MVAIFPLRCSFRRKERNHRFVREKPHFLCILRASWEPPESTGGIAAASCATQGVFKKLTLRPEKNVCVGTNIKMLVFQKKSRWHCVWKECTLYKNVRVYKTRVFKNKCRCLKKTWKKPKFSRAKHGCLGKNGILQKNGVSFKHLHLFLNTRVL